MSPDKKNSLFEEFPPVSTKQWEDKIREDLKGADYEKKLIWQTLEGIKIKPYYRSEDLKDLIWLQIPPGEFPYLRGKNTKENNWIVRQDILEQNPERSAKLAWDAVQKGAHAIGFDVSEVETYEDVALLLKNIDLNNVAIHFLHSRNYPAFFNIAVDYMKKSGFDIQNIKGSMDFDPLAYFVLYDKFYHSQEKDLEETVKIVELAMRDLPHFDVLQVNGQHYHNAGAHTVQEMAFTLSHANDYLAHLTDKGLNVDDIAPRMQFTMATGSEFFKEIAKFRAMKLLWAQIVKQYAPTTPDSMKINIHATSSEWNKSVYDPHVNLLRTTTETMAAGLAGADTISIAPYDSTFQKPDQISNRIARNQQIVLKYEAYMNKVADPAGGSYYIEKITDDLASEAWQMFVKIENEGGFIKAVESGFIKEEIAKTCQKREMNIATRRQIFVGVNQYPNLQETMLEKLKPVAKFKDLSGLRPWRGPQAFEALRLSVENFASKGFQIPKVYLFTHGNLTMRKARASFITGFFGCAGYKIQEAPLVKNLQEGIEKALEAKPEIIVLCSSDEEYADMIPAIKEIREKLSDTQIVVAGNPADSVQVLNEAGVQHYISLRTNLLETLQHFNQIFGIV